MSKQTAGDIARTVGGYFEADDEELVENLTKEIELYHTQKLQEFEERIREFKNDTNEKIKKSNNKQRNLEYGITLATLENVLQLITQHNDDGRD